MSEWEIMVCFCFCFIYCNLEELSFCRSHSFFFLCFVFCVLYYTLEHA